MQTTDIIGNLEPAGHVSWFVRVKEGQLIVVLNRLCPQGLQKAHVCYELFPPACLY